MTWYHSNKILPAKTRFKPNYDLYTGIASLKIDDINLEDAGKYKVVAENIAGKGETSADALVQKHDRLKSQAALLLPKHCNFYKMDSYQNQIMWNNVI